MGNYKFCPIMSAGKYASQTAIPAKAACSTECSIYDEERGKCGLQIHALLKVDKVHQAVAKAEDLRYNLKCTDAEILTDLLKELNNLN